MSFFDSLKKGAVIVGQAVGEQIQSDFTKMQKMKSDVDFYQQKFESLSDEELLRKFRSSSGSRKIACGRLLKARGYRPKAD
ncbi:hypothetical protein [uncultured Oscillibacter sp.]|jgi:hypothetical protein|uniref:hypothetical protein n=1 Tax=uncultured Oscillibacter sp. TaxID=876091 RepID=UPI0025E155DC|nr:hypothetical protein [uncultured Oscillibacter sp.]